MVSPKAYHKEQEPTDTEMKKEILNVVTKSYIVQYTLDLYTRNETSD